MTFEIHKTATSERDVLSYAKKRLSAYGVVVRVTKGTWYRHGMARDRGVFDLVWFASSGETIVIECKRPGETKLRPDQSAFACTLIRECGSRDPRVVNSYDQIDELIRDFG